MNRFTPAVLMNRSLAISRRLLACGLVAAATSAPAVTLPTYTNFVRQVQVVSGVQQDVSVAALGAQFAAMAINDGGARFELWTVLQSPLTSYLLDSKLVGSYVPQATVTITSADTTCNAPRTRADKPFTVTVNVQGISADPTAPVPAKQVDLLRYVQSYGTGGTGVGLDRTLATLLSTSYLTTNGNTVLTYALTSVPGSNRAKLWGEERFTVNSEADYQTPVAQIASQTVQIWPVADASISGITNNQTIAFSLPAVTLQYNDLYPYSTTYAQVYQGTAQLGRTGSIVAGSSVVVNDTVSQSRTLTLSNWDTAIPGDGQWTMEVITATPFGVERLAYVTFNLDRTIEVHGAVTTLE